MQVPHMQPGMRSSSRSNRKVQPDAAGIGGHDVAQQLDVTIAGQPNLAHIKENDLAEQPHVAVAGRPDLAALLAAASAMQKSPGGRHTEEEVCHISDKALRTRE